MRSLQQTIADLVSRAGVSRAEGADSPSERLSILVTRLHASAAESLQKLRSYAAGAATLRRQIVQRDERIRELRAALDALRKPSKGTFSVLIPVVYSLVRFLE